MIGAIPAAKQSEKSPKRPFRLDLASDGPQETRQRRNRGRGLGQLAGIPPEIRANTGLTFGINLNSHLK
jgi:hypothetical protein